MDANVWNKKKNLSLWVYTFYDMIAITAGKKLITYRIRHRVLFVLIHLQNCNRLH